MVAINVSTFVICPVRNEWDTTRDMLASLDAAEVDDVLIMDHGSTDGTARHIRSWQRNVGRWAAHFPLGAKIHRQAFDPAQHSIYDMWNAGFERARKIAGHELADVRRAGRYVPFYVLVTNNDVVLPKGALPLLRRQLEQDTDCWVAYPDYDAPWVAAPDWSSISSRYTRGVLSDGGMSGSCFMLAGHRIPWSPLITDTSYHWWYGDNHLAECIEQAGGRQARVAGLPIRHYNEGTARYYPELEARKYADRQLWITRFGRMTRGG